MKNVLYLAPDGNDMASGFTADRSDAFNGPMRSLDAAVRRIRSMRAENPELGSCEILVHSGVYKLCRPVVFYPQDSEIRIRALEPGRAVFRGSEAVSGFERVELEQGVSAFRADVSDLIELGFAFRSLYTENLPLRRARWPEEGFMKIQRFAAQLDGRPIVEGQHRFFVDPADLPPNWNPGRNLSASTFLFWVHDVADVESVNPDTGEVVMNRKTSINPGYGGWGNVLLRAVLEHDKRFLKRPGDWVLDRDAGELFVVPPDGADPSTFTAHAPVLSQWVRLEGDPDRGETVSDVHFEGLAFEHADWQPGEPGDRRWNPDPSISVRSRRPILPHLDDPTPMPRSMAGSVQAAVHLPGAVQARAAVRCVWRECVFRQCGTYGLLLDDGCRDCTVEHSRFSGMGGGGVYVDGSSDPGDAGRISSDIRIADCEISNGGTVFFSACGILVTHAAGVTLEHNTIHHMPYSGISVGWTWGFEPTVCRDLQIVGNHIYHLGRNSGLNDMGGIYTLGWQPGSRISDNVIEDVHSDLYAGWGIYLDEGSAGFVVENNLVWDTRSHSVHEHWGRQNIFRSNLFAYGSNGGITPNHDPSHAWVKNPAPGTEVRGNIILTRGYPAFHDSDGLIEHRDVQNGFFHHDANLIWDEEEKENSSLWWIGDEHDSNVKWVKLGMKDVLEMGQEKNGRIVDPGVQKDGLSVSLDRSALPEDVQINTDIWKTVGPRNI